MSKGNAVSQFKIGQRVMFHTNIGHKVYRNDTDEAGKTVRVFERNVHIDQENFGKIVKLHKSAKQGSAEIKTEDGKKITRRLQFVEAVA